MPRLVLSEDDGVVLFAAEVSRANVERVAGLLRKHMDTIKTIADARRAVSTVLDSMDQVAALVDSRRPIRINFSRRDPRRQKRRPTI